MPAVSWRLVSGEQHLGSEQRPHDNLPTDTSVSALANMHLMYTIDANGNR